MLLGWFGGAYEGGKRSRAKVPFIFRDIHTNVHATWPLASRHSKPPGALGGAISGLAAPGKASKWLWEHAATLWRHLGIIWILQLPRGQVNLGVDRLNFVKYRREYNIYCGS